MVTSLVTKFNIDKTLAMDIGGNISQTFKEQSGFKWPNEGIKYLGIQIPHSLSDLFKVNYEVLVAKIKKDLERWTVLSVAKH